MNARATPECPFVLTRERAERKVWEREPVFHTGAEYSLSWTFLSLSFSPLSEGAV